MLNIACESGKGLLDIRHRYRLEVVVDISWPFCKHILELIEYLFMLVPEVVHMSGRNSFRTHVHTCLK